MKHFKLIRSTSKHLYCCKQSTAAYNKEKPKDTVGSQSSPPSSIKRDWIGPPDALSNLRPVIFHEPKCETLTQKRFRELRVDTQIWNQKYWEKHNIAFTKAKEEFIKSQTPEGEPLKQLSAEDISIFYRQFLNENYKSHMKYNKEWYIRNISLLWPALKVSVEKLLMWKK